MYGAIAAASVDAEALASSVSNASLHDAQGGAIQQATVGDVQKASEGIRNGTVGACHRGSDWLTAADMRAADCFDAELLMSAARPQVAYARLERINTLPPPNPPSTHNPPRQP